MSTQRFFQLGATVAFAIVSLQGPGRPLTFNMARANVREYQSMQGMFTRETANSGGSQIEDSLPTGLEVEVDPKKIAQLKKYIHNTLDALNDMLAQRNRLNYSGQRRYLANQINSLLNQNSRYNETLSLIVLRRALALAEIIEKEANINAPGVIDQQVGMLWKHVEMAKKWLGSAQYYLKDTFPGNADSSGTVSVNRVVLPYAEFSLSYLSEMKTINENMIDASAQYKIAMRLAVWTVPLVQRDKFSGLYAEFIGNVATLLVNECYGDKLEWVKEYASKHVCAVQRKTDSDFINGMTDIRQALRQAFKGRPSASFTPFLTEEGRNPYASPVPVGQRLPYAGPVRDESRVDVPFDDVEILKAPTEEIDVFESHKKNGTASLAYLPYSSKSHQSGVCRRLGHQQAMDNGTSESKELKTALVVSENGRALAVVQSTTLAAITCVGKFPSSTLERISLVKAPKIPVSLISGDRTKNPVRQVSDFEVAFRENQVTPGTNAICQRLGAGLHALNAGSPASPTTDSKAIVNMGANGPSFGGLTPNLNDDEKTSSAILNLYCTNL